VKTKNPKMKNPLRSDGFFNRYQATKDRSPRFRAFVILLLLVFSCILIYGLAFIKSKSLKADEVIAQPASAVSK
jgi:hypothetical protein